MHFTEFNTVKCLTKFTNLFQTVLSFATMVYLMGQNITGKSMYHAHCYENVLSLVRMLKSIVSLVTNIEKVDFMYKDVSYLSFRIMQLQLLRHCNINTMSVEICRKQKKVILLMYEYYCDNTAV